MEQSMQEKIIRGIKLGVLTLIGAGASLAGVAYLKAFFANAEGGALLLALLFISIFLIVVALETMFVQKIWHTVLFSVVQALAPAFLFFDVLFPKPSIILVAGLAVFLLLHLEGLRRGQKIRENGIRLEFFAASRAAVPKVITGFLLLVSIVSYLTLFQDGQFSKELGRKFSDVLVDQAEPIMQIWFPGADADQKISEFFRAAAEEQMRKQEEDSTLDERIKASLSLLKEEDKERAIQEVAGKLTEQAEKLVGKINTNESVKDVTFRLFETELEKLQNSSKLGSMFGIAVSVIIFGLLRSVAFLLAWIVEAIAFAIYHVLIALGFAHITLENTSREKISI